MSSARDNDPAARNTAWPWDPDPEGLVKSIQTQVPCGRAILGVVEPQDPKADEILLAQGCQRGDLVSWLAGGHRHDPLYRAALREGTSTWSPGGPGTGSPLAPGQHALMHMLAEPTGRPRSWWFLAARDGKPFEKSERDLARILLHQWQCGFATVSELDMGRLLLGHDHRVLLADLATQALAVRRPDTVRRLVESVLPVVADRWPDLKDREMRDLVIAVDGRSVWVCVRCRWGLQATRSQQWYLEVRRCDRLDVPPLGVLSDARLSKAIAFIHDQYSQSPGLAQIARHVHVSPTYFQRLFTRVVGISPKQYLVRKQVQVARWMLRTTRLPVGHIAGECGFKSHAHFTSTFQKALGMTPSEFRERG